MEGSGASESPVLSLKLLASKRVAFVVCMRRELGFDEAHLWAALQDLPESLASTILGMICEVGHADGDIVRRLVRRDTASLNLRRIGALVPLDPLSWCQQLREVDFGEAGCEGWRIEAALASLPRGSLEWLSLAATRVTAEGVAAICAHHGASLTYLDASETDMRGVGEGGDAEPPLATALSRAPALRHLYLARAEGVDDAAVTALAQSGAPLESLDVTACRQVTRLPRFDASPRGLTLLRVGELPYVDDNGLCGALRSCSGALAEFVACELDIGPRSLELLTATDGLGSLAVLDLSWVEEVDGEALHVLAQGLGPALRALRLRCTAVGDAVVAEVSRRCPGLEEIDLCRGGPVTDASATALGARCPSLRSVDVGWSDVGDEGACALLRGCPALRCLSLEGCKGVTAAIADAVVAAPTLRLLDCSWVNNFSSKVASSLRTLRPNLQVLDYYTENVDALPDHGQGAEAPSRSAWFILEDAKARPLGFGRQ